MEKDPYLEKTDEELVRLTLENRENYKYLMQRYGSKLTRYIIRLSGINNDDAQDVLQTVFLKAYQNLNGFDTSLKFSSWIYRITHNETVTYLRKMSSRPKIINSQTNEDIVGLIKSDLDIVESIDKKVLEEKLRDAINALDGKYRDVLVLKYIEDKDYKEISDILRKPPGTVATLLMRAKEKLKEEIVKRGIINKLMHSWIFRRKH
jgi:RNA polymerase sigma-70 factor, ECF subfamily